MAPCSHNRNILLSTSQASSSFSHDSLYHVVPHLRSPPDRDSNSGGKKNVCYCAGILLERNHLAHFSLCFLFGFGMKKKREWVLLFYTVYLSSDIFLYNQTRKIGLLSSNFLPFLLSPSNLFSNEQSLSLFLLHYLIFPTLV